MAKEIDYAQLQQELEEIIESLQSGSLSIDKAIEAHERGQTIVKDLQEYLKTAENKVKKALI